MAEKARRFLRVSSKIQREEHQIEHIDSFACTHGLVIDGIDYQAHGLSASKGYHLRVLEQAFADMRDGEYTVLLMWDSSRFTRMGAVSAFELMAKARESGGRILFCAPHAQYLNEASNEWSDVRLSIQATSDHLQSKRQSEQTLRDVARHQAIGSARGRPPFGWVIVGSKDHKMFVPTDEGRRLLPEMYRLCIEGWSCHAIAEWITIQTGKKISAGVVNQILKNPVNTGRRRGGGNLETEELIPFSLYEKAVVALEARRSGGAISKKPGTAFVKPYCLMCLGRKRDGSPSGMSPMYRFKSNPTPYVYRCMGHGPQRSGCGTRMIPAALLEDAVIRAYSNNSEPRKEHVLIPGSDSGSELERVGKEIAEAASIGDFGKVAELNGRATELQAQNPETAHWELRDTGYEPRAMVRECIMERASRVPAR